MKSYVLYHWSPAVNAKSIAKLGLDPTFAKGARKCIWCCCVEVVGMLRDHIALHHEVHPTDLMLFECQVVEDAIRRSPWSGIFWLPGVVPRSLVYPAPNVEGDIILGRLPDIISPEFARELWRKHWRVPPRTANIDDSES